MSNVQFDDSKSSYNSQNMSTKSRGMAGWLVSKGWAKDEKGANTSLAVFAILCLIAAAYVATIPSREEKERLEAMQINPNQNNVPTNF
jgi:hypothetical protein